MAQSAIPFLIILAAGCLAALQAPMNAALGRGLDSGVAAATISFGVGFAVLFTVTLFGGEFGNLGRAGQVNRWLLISGALGAFYVWAILWTIPLLGVVTAISAMILGQVLVALILDAFGIFGLPKIEISIHRLLGVLLVAGGLVLSRV